MITYLLVAKEVLRGVWNYKFELLSLLLSIAIVALVIEIDGQDQKIKQEQKAHLEYVAEQELAAVQQANVWKDRIIKAEREFSEKAKALERERTILADDVDRLHEQLDKASVRYVTASNESKLEYTNTLRNVFEKCVNEYRTLATLADGHANDARLMYDTWPQVDIVRPPE